MAVTGQMSARRLTLRLLRSGRFNGRSKAIIRQMILTGQRPTPNAADPLVFRRVFIVPIAERRMDSSERQQGAKDDPSQFPLLLRDSPRPARSVRVGSWTIVCLLPPTTMLGGAT
jgi:hypothetical protein